MEIMEDPSWLQDINRGRLNVYKKAAEYKLSNLFANERYRSKVEVYYSKLS